MNELTPTRRGLIVGIWLAWMSIIFYFSTQSWGGAETESWLDQFLSAYLSPVREILSGSGLGELNFVVRKLAHFTEYAILTTLGYWAWTKGILQSSLSALRYALLGSILFAISDEFHQLFEPGRTSLLTDVLIDSLGASVATLLIYWFVISVQSSAPSS